MSNEFIINTSPVGSEVKLQTDTQGGYTANPYTDERPDGQIIVLPDDLVRQGANLIINSEGYDEFNQRGIVKPAIVCPRCHTAIETQAFFWLDDVHLKESYVPPPQPEPEPPTPLPPGSQEPLDYINSVYATGNYNLATHVGCGTFTEECCRVLAHNLGAQWGHVGKRPGQNQYNNHAVDALMCLFGEYTGIWDIIISSVSSSAKPAFNDAGDVNPEIWRPYQPLPCQPAAQRTVILLQR
jgi:hypothetical protein